MRKYSRKQKKRQDVSYKVNRWRNGGMALRWTVTGLIEAEKRL